MCITRTVFYLAQRNAFQDAEQFIAGRLDGILVLICRRQFKGPFLQMLIEDGEAISLKLKQFKGVTAFADENIDVTIEHIFVQITGNDGRKAVKTFSHIGWMTTKKITALFRQVKHPLRDERLEILWIHCAEEANGSFAAEGNLTKRSWVYIYRMYRWKRNEIIS